jgi:DNA-binding GntR family transcriptional regulator
LNPVVTEFKRATLADRCYEYVREQLLDGTLRPGRKLSIEVLCGSLGVSRHPVMEAVKRLEYEGFISIHPQIGCRVVETDPADVHDFFTFFAAAEALCARHAAEKRTPADVRQLRATSHAVGDLRSHSGRPERSRAYRALDERLHAQIRRLRRSRIVDEISSRLWHRADFLVTSVAGANVHSERLDTAHAEHEQIVDAIDGGRTEDAYALMQAHVLNFSNLIAPASNGANA